MPPKFPLNSNSRSNDSHPLTAKKTSQVLLTFFMALLQYEEAASDRFPYSHPHKHSRSECVLALLPSNEIVLTEPRSLVEGSRG